MSNANPKPEPTPPKRPTEPPRTPGVDWRMVLWYLPMLLVLLWLWQDVFSGVNVRTIPYSEFRDRVAEGHVVSVEIRETEIVGEIDPRLGKEPAEKPAEKPAAEEAKKPAAEKPAAEKPAANKPTAEKPATTPPAKPQTGPAAPAAGETPTAGEKAAESDAPFMFRTVRVEDPKLVEDLQAAGVKFEGVRPGFLSSVLLAWVLPIVLITMVYWFLSRRISSAGQAVMSVGRSKARLVADKSTGVTFADVAGCDEAKYELEEVVDFLKNPQRYEALGAKIPKGILLVGPPGTGKTLMARAVAGEAGVAFYSLSGSDFVEMFVGVGAARVRDLFEQAKKTAPCIVFIDELDAIGRQRGVHLGPVNDEREQTLNQLLVELDGFEANVGVIVMGATNRPDVLDRALLRPGRFDRQVVIDAPDIDGREAILRVHSRGKPLAEDVDFRALAQATAGFSGADLANTLNEAALLAARRRAKHITQKDLEDAVEKLVAGPERTSRRLDAQEKRRVAIHEVGHALVAAHSEHADPVHKISIVPRGRAALGYTLQLPEVEQFLMTESGLRDRIRGMLGGRAAEELVLEEVSTGAENDLERATALARRMVATFGMSDTVGLVHCDNRPGGEYMGTLAGMPAQRDCSEATSRLIDEEVRQILERAYEEARQVLGQHRDELDVVTEELLKRESLDGDAFNALFGRPPRPRKGLEPVVGHAGGDAQ